MTLLWLRPPHGELGFSSDERRVRDYLSARGGVSESATSLAAKLDMSRRRCRKVLEQLAEEGVLRRRDFEDIEPMYCRFPPRG